MLPKLGHRLAEGALAEKGVLIDIQSEPVGVNFVPDDDVWTSSGRLSAFLIDGVSEVPQQLVETPRTSCRGQGCERSLRGSGDVGADDERGLALPSTATAAPSVAIRRARGIDSPFAVGCPSIPRCRHQAAMDDRESRPWPSRPILDEQRRKAPGSASVISTAEHLGPR